MMLLALALNLDPVYVGAHHLTRIFFVLFTMPLIARTAARQRIGHDASGTPPKEPPKPPARRPPFQD
jgi:hypothetical protein